MTRIILDASFQQKLHNLTQPLELCNESGKVLARLTPIVDIAQYKPLVPQVSEEELDRRAQSDEPTFTTAEVLAYLEKL